MSVFKSFFLPNRIIVPYNYGVIRTPEIIIGHSYLKKSSQFSLGREDYFCR